MIYVIQDEDGNVKSVVSKDTEEGQFDMNPYCIKKCIDAGRQPTGVVHWDMVQLALSRNMFKQPDFQAVQLMKPPTFPKDFCLHGEQ